MIAAAIARSHSQSFDPIRSHAVQHLGIFSHVSAENRMSGDPTKRSRITALLHKEKYDLGSPISLQILSIFTCHRGWFGWQYESKPASLQFGHHMVKHSSRGWLIMHQ